jgi:hypothetical protein
MSGKPPHDGWQSAIALTGAGAYGSCGHAGQFFIAFRLCQSNPYFGGE